MGQSSSSQREDQDLLNRDSHRFSQHGSDRVDRVPLTIRPHGSLPTQSDQISSPRSRRQSQQPESQNSQPFATFSRQISAQSVPVRGNLGSNDEASTRDEIFYEQQEIRPLVHMEDLGMRNGPITHITASPMPRRHSILSRFSSRIVPRNSGSISNLHEERTERRPTRPRLSNRLLITPQTSNPPDQRFSFRRPLSTGLATFSRPRRQRDLTSISRPFPLVADGSLHAPNFAISPLHDTRFEDNPTFDTSNRLTNSNPLSRRASRFSRLHRSLSLPFESLSATNRNNTSRGRDAQNSPRRPSRGSMADDAEYRLPPLSVTDHSIELSSSASEQNRSANGDHRSQTSPSAEPSQGALDWADPPSATERRAERGSLGRRDTRRMPNIRGRSSRLIRRDDEGPLPRILHLAATAIAAQLSGTPEQAITNIQAIGADGLDGSLNALFRTLQQATTSTGDTHPAARDADTNRSSGTLPPLNFLRVFRFVNSNSDRGRAPRSRPEGEDPQTIRGVDASEDSDGRTVTLVVVGVRSVPSERLDHEDAIAAEPSLDTLLSLPVAPSANPSRNGPGGLLRHVDGRSRFSQRRRASMGGLGSFPTNFESQRHRMLSPTRQSSADATTTGPSNMPLSLSESPPGPHPPPSTPAEPGISTYSSGTTTPSRRPSSASAAQRSLLSNHDMARPNLREVGMLTAEDDAIRVVQQRRRSDSEFARHRDLGAGAARRNGVVEPDQMESGEPPAHGSRSWLIYVVGTNLSEDHPAFATPSLFTDVRTFLFSRCFGNAHADVFSRQNPTYEDMLLLSSLLGPAKPPVASREDVASALGVHRIQTSGGLLVATAFDGTSEISIAPGERCLVCLCEYEADEQVRQLVKCAHMFHRECIDEVSPVR